MIANLIRAKGTTALIASMDGREARIVPAHVITRGQGQRVTLTESDWQRGIEPSFNFNFTELCIPVDALTAELHKRGLYSSADLRAQMRLAREAVDDAAGNILARILNGG